MAQPRGVLDPDRRIDCTGLFCPMPVVRTREVIRQMIPGQLLEMLADDPGAEADMKIWAHVAGYELTQVARDGAVFRFLVRKTG